MAVDHDFQQYPELSNSQLETLQFLSPHPQITEDFEAVVEEVTDGDTITLSTSFRDFLFPLRLLDIDAPELSEGGEETKAWLRGRLLGNRVWVEIDRDNRVGKYGRLLGRVIHGGLDVGEEMLVLGLAAKFGEREAHEPEPVDKVFRLGQWF